MKERSNFVSNSSSTSFVITNKTKEKLHIRDFVEYNPQIIEDWVKDNREFPFEYYQSHSGKTYKILDFNHLMMTLKEEADEKERRLKGSRQSFGLQPGDTIIEFGDEDGTLLGEIYDYYLRNGGETRRYKWRFHEFNR